MTASPDLGARLRRLCQAIEATDKRPVMDTRAAELSEALNAVPELGTANEVLAAVASARREDPGGPVWPAVERAATRLQEARRG